MAKNKKTIVGEVADSVSTAVASAIDALAHPMDTATEARRALGRAVTAGKRKVAAKKKVAKKAARKATRKAASKVKSVARKTVKKATKRIKRR